METLISIFFYVLMVVVSLRVSIGLAAMSWFPAFLVIGGYNPHASRLLAAALADSLAAGGDPAADLGALHGQLDGPSAKRLRRFQAILTQHADLMGALRESRLLPPPQQQLLEQCSDDRWLLERSLRRYGDQERDSDSGNSVLPNALATVSVLMSWLVLILAFLIAVIIPKFEQVFIELAVELPWTTEVAITVSRFFGRLGLFGFFLIISITASTYFLPRALSWWWHAWQPGARALQRGRLIIDGLALGLAEVDLARLVKLSLPQPAVADLAQSCGFKASTPAALASAVLQAEVRRRHFLELAGTTSAILLWLLAASVVGFVVYAMFAPLVTILEVISNDM